MSVVARLPKIPLSPSSPPESGLKQRSKRRLSEDAPNSPRTPPLMSVAAKSYAGSYGNAQSSTKHASQVSPVSPASSSAYTQQSTQAVNQSFPTPASSAFDMSKAATVEDQHRDKRQRMDNDGRDQRGEDNTVLPMNHDRQPSADEAGFVREASRDNATTNSESHANGENHASTEVASLEKLRKDMGDAFLLCKSTIPRSRLDPKTNLVSRFGLGSLRRSVARTDPVTGEKINKLRKSYMAQIEKFALAGRNKAVPTERLENEKHPLRSMVEDTSDQQWEETHGQSPIEATSDFRAKLQKAMQLQPGTVRNVGRWDDALGHEKTRPGVTVPAVPAYKASSTAAPTRQTNGIPRPQVQTTATVARPRRTGKKRSYGEDTYVGYGEGFVDDDEEPDDRAFDDDEDDGSGPPSAKKKRRKEYSFSISPTSYGGGYAR